MEAPEPSECDGRTPPSELEHGGPVANGPCQAGRDLGCGGRPSRSAMEAPELSECDGRAPPSEDGGPVANALCQAGRDLGCGGRPRRSAMEAPELSESGEKVTGQRVPRATRAGRVTGGERPGSGRQADEGNPSHTPRWTRWRTPTTGAAAAPRFLSCGVGAGSIRPAERAHGLVRQRAGESGGRPEPFAFGRAWPGPPPSPVGSR